MAAPTTSFHTDFNLTTLDLRQKRRKMRSTTALLTQHGQQITHLVLF